MNETLKSDLKHYLESIDDPRRSKGKIYPLYQLLVCLFYGVFCGYDNSSDIEDFVDVNFDYFNKTFSLKDVPSHVTFSRIMRMLDVKTLASALSVFLAEKYPKICRIWWQKSKILKISIITLLLIKIKGKKFIFNASA